jgi:glycosyltransferase involved in cell wall biosynthesis
MGVTVVIPHKNDSALIPRALNSIRAQTYQPNQVIVIDDWSNDCQKKLLDQVVVENKAVLPIECVKSHGHGLSAARNTGIKLANQEIIAFLDCDDEWRFDKLERQIKKYLDSSLQNDEGIKKLLTAVSQSYNNYERDKELSDHAFTI